MINRLGDIEFFPYDECDYVLHRQMTTLFDFIKILKRQGKIYLRFLSSKKMRKA